MVLHIFFFIIIEWILNKAREPFKLMEIQQKRDASVYLHKTKKTKKQEENQATQIFT